MDESEKRDAGRVKEELIASARNLLRDGLVEGTSGNLSSRLANGTVVMTPSSHPYEEMGVEDLVVVDMRGEVLEGRRAPTTEKDLHLACLDAHPELGAVIHSHAIYASMFAVAQKSIPCVIEEVEIFVGGDIPVADYQLTGSGELGAEVARHVADRGAVLMANHGLLTVGRDIAEAMKLTRLVERTAQIVWGSSLLGNPAPLPEDTRERFAPIYKMLRNR